MWGFGEVVAGAGGAGGETAVVLDFDVDVAIEMRGLQFDWGGGIDGDEFVGRGVVGGAGCDLEVVFLGIDHLEGRCRDLWRETR